MAFPVVPVSDDLPTIPVVTGPTDIPITTRVVTVEAPKARSLKVTCEFCGCTLLESGDVFKMSDEAKRLRKLEDQVETLRDELALTTRDLNAAKSEAASLRQVNARERSGVLFDR